jgi:hypothetical protein
MPSVFGIFCGCLKPTGTAASGCTNDIEVSRLRLTARVKCIESDGFHPDNIVNQFGALLVIPFGQLRRNRRQITKQSAGAMIRSRCEVHLRGGGGCGIAVGRADISGAE